MEAGDGAEQRCGPLAPGFHGPSCLGLCFPADGNRSWAGSGTAEGEIEQALNVCASPNGLWIFAGWLSLGFAEVKLQFPSRAS